MQHGACILPCSEQRAAAGGRAESGDRWRAEGSAAAAAASGEPVVEYAGKSNHTGRCPLWLAHTHAPLHPWAACGASTTLSWPGTWGRRRVGWSRGTSRCACARSRGTRSTGNVRTRARDRPRTRPAAHARPPRCPAPWPPAGSAAAGGWGVELAGASTAAITTRAGRGTWRRRAIRGACHHRRERGERGSGVGRGAHLAHALPDRGASVAYVEELLEGQPAEALGVHRERALQVLSGTGVGRSAAGSTIR